jgi:hypothetical protein
MMLSLACGLLRVVVVMIWVDHDSGSMLWFEHWYGLVQMKSPSGDVVSIAWIY